MKIAVFSAQKFEIEYLNRSNENEHIIDYFPELLNKQSVDIINGHEAIVVFVNDTCDAEILNLLHQKGVKFIALRCAGYNNVDLETAKNLGIKVSNVPAYSPYSIAEHAVALLLALNRKIVKAHNQIQKNNYTLNELKGFDLHGKTVGVIGTGKIGCIFSKIMVGFGCKVIASDPVENAELKQKDKVEYVDLESLFKKSDIISLHAPLNPQTNYLINDDSINKMKDGVVIINTSRGGLINTKSAIDQLKNGKIGALGIDVYEHEKGIFFFDHEKKGVTDPILEELKSLSNVLITPHQAFMTHEALTNIADTTIANLSNWGKTGLCDNEL